MKKLFTLILPLFTILALSGPGSVAAQVGDPCDGLSLSWNWGCEASGGWASVEISGAANPTSIMWSNGATTPYISSIPSGSYWVMVTDGNGCTVQENFDVLCDLDPDCAIDADVLWGCHSATSGWAAVENITGANGQISYLWSTGATTQYVSDIPDGDHWVMVLSDQDCWVKKFFTVGCYISPDCMLGANVSWGCFDTTSAWASVDIWGATDSVSILWSNGETSQMATGFGNGDHWVMVSEAADCWVKHSFTVACEMDPDCPLDVVVDYGCEGEGAGWASIESLIGGDASTVVYWSTGDTTMSISGLSSGSYYLILMNTETCWLKYHFDLECGTVPGCDLDADLEWGCNGPISGWASVGNITGATGATSILWSTGDTSQFVSDLPNGTHYVTITDSEGCSVTKEITVNCWVSPDCTLGASVTWGCFDTTSAWASVDIWGATDSVSILWSNGETTQMASALTNGDHWVMVSEAEDCWVKHAFTISCEMDPDCPLDIEVDHGCIGDGPGYAAIEDLIGTNESTVVMWSTGDTTMTISGLVSGDYFVVVMNSETCWLKHHFEIDCEVGMMPGVDVVAFPVPANNILNLEIGTDIGGVISFMVMDPLGRVMMSQGNEAFQAGERRTVTLGVNTLENGSYLLTVLRDGVMMRTERVIISR